MKTFKHVIYFFFVLFILTNCDKKEDLIKPDFQLDTADNVDVNEYQIYSLILNEVFTGSNDLVIEQKTSSGISISFGNTYYESLKVDNFNLDTTIFNDFIEKNDTVYNLDKKFSSTTKSIILISSEELKYLFNSHDLNKDWEEFYERYPKSNGLIEFTRVGFNTGKTQGIVEIGHYYASLGSDGFLIYIVKENGTWQIVKIINRWVS